MTELAETIILANRMLDRINADPDDALAMLSRQFLRAREEIAQSRKLCQLWIDQGAKQGQLITELALALETLIRFNRSNCLEEERLIQRAREVKS